MLEWRDEEDNPQQKEFPDYPGIAKRYCEMICSGEVRHGLYIRQAAKRYLDMLEEAAKPGALFYFSDAWACDFLDFFEKLRLPSGGKPGDTFIAQPFQIWIGCALFGFRRNDPDAPNEIGTRLTREVFVEIPRGSGKSPLSAAIALYCWLHEEENGSQIFIGAPKEEQANYVYDPLKAMITETPGLMEHYGIEEPTQKIIRKKSDPMARVRKISSIADREDGANPHVVVMEELHAQDEELFNVMDSSLGKRVNNLFVSITTAGKRAMGVCWSTRKRLINVLAGARKEPSFFGLLFELDPEVAKERKEALKPENWLVVNPMWNITLSATSLLERYAKAQAQSPAAVDEFLRTRLNIWTTGAGGLVDPLNWEKCERKGIDLLDYRGRRAWIGGDLASKNDIASIGIIIDDDDNPDLITVFNEHFVPTQAPSFRHEEFGPLYDSWVRGGHMTLTHGPVIDYTFIEERIRRWCELFDVQAISFDNYQSNEILSRLFNDGFPAVQFQPGTKAISDPAKEFFAKIEGGLLVHDGNPVTQWMALNVVGYVDQRDNLLPKKESPNSPYKIDGIAALIAGYIVRADRLREIKVKKKSVYETRGLLGAEE